jgi:cystathionine beta-lyase/cystathionine gamma-synthase
VASKNGFRYKILRKINKIKGSILGNLETYLLLRSLRSVSVRIKKQSKNATKIALWLAEQKQV